METPITIPSEVTFTPTSGTFTNSIDGAAASEKYAHMRLTSVITSTILAALILLISAYGFLRPIDDWLQDARYTLLDRPPTGNVVFLEIDAASLQAVGVWPWPRTIHAAIVDRLSEMGAKSMIFDIDFSAASIPKNDTSFAAALKRAGGFAVLGAFEQPGRANGSDKVINTPIAELAAASELVSVDVPLGDGNVVRDYPLSRLVGGRRIPSLGAALGLHKSFNNDGLFGINFAINVRAIDHISVADLLAGKVAIDRLRGRDVVIGASAQELRDFFVTPRFGMIPGGLVHVLATETLIQDLAMRDAPWPLAATIIAFLALLAGILGHQLSGVRGLFGAAATATVVELVAFWLQWEQALRVSSASIHVALLVFVVAGMVSDLRLRRKLYAQAAHEREFMRAMLRQVIADDFDGVVIVDESGQILANSREALAFLVTPGDGGAPVLPPALYKLTSDCFAVEVAGQLGVPTSGQLAISLADKGLRYLDYVATKSSIDNTYSKQVVCLTFRDVTERRAEQERLTFLASHDPSTGAWLRHWLIWNMETHLNSTSRSETMTLILIELRRFDSVTNALGDTIGERVLQSVLARLRAEGHQMVARIGDANFAIAVLNQPGRLPVLQLCHALIKKLVEPYAIGDRKITIGVDLGVAISSTSGDRAETLLTQARIAQAAARIGAVNHHEIFSPNMEAEFTEREWIETALRQALVLGQFTLDYQPQFDLGSGECVGAEALLRWHHPKRGLISPGKFIAIAEESRLIIEIGRWAMETACQEAARWPERMYVAVNVSPIQFESPELLAEVCGALELSGLPSTRLTIEITESAFVTGGVDTIALLEALRAEGIDIALDDFGTGYSSLGYLDRLPFDKLKIDQSFIKRMLADRGAAAIVQSILQLAEKLDKTVVAEGVETAAQAKQLQKFGCQAVQGYYFGRPMAAIEFRKKFAIPNSVSIPLEHFA